MDGICYIDQDMKIIKVESHSKQLIEDIALLFTYFGIFVLHSSNNDDLLYSFNIPHKYARKYLEEINTNIDFNRESLLHIIKFSETRHNANTDFFDIIPELGHIIYKISKILNIQRFSTLNTHNLDIDRSTLIRYINIFKHRSIAINKFTEIKEDLEYLDIIANGDVIWDKIKSIKIIVENIKDKEYVYDLTIPGNETFMLYNGIIVHNTLNTFHTAGVGVIGMQGIPRFRELLSYSKKIQTPGMIVRFIKEVRNDENIAHKIEAYLKHTLLEKLINNLEIIYDPITKNLLEKDNINSNNIYYIGNTINIIYLPWLYRLSVNRETMLENDITLLDIKTKFIKFFEDYAQDSTINRKKVIISKILNGCIMSNYDNSQNQYIHIRFDINIPDNYTLIEIGQYILNKISIKGINTIKNVDPPQKQKIIEYNSDNGLKSDSNEWVLYMDGIDLNKLKTIKYVDFNRLVINDIYTAYLNFGIEAARNLIYIQTDKVYIGSSNNINDAHLLLLADIMTNNGNITSIDRHGINRLDTDPLSRASFEKTVEQLLMASAFNEIDYMKSVSSRIMAGRCIKGGTGLCEILMNNDMLENSEYNDKEKINIDTINRLEENELMKDLLTKPNKINTLWIPS